jgi:hypothetical protein
LGKSRDVPREKLIKYQKLPLFSHDKKFSPTRDQILQ